METGHHEETLRQWAKMLDVPRSAALGELLNGMISRMTADLFVEYFGCAAREG